LTCPADGDTYNARDEEINLSGEQYWVYKDSFTEEKKSLLDDLAESKNIKEHSVHATNKAMALDTMHSDVLALASGQKAMAFWLWYQGESQAKILVWHGFWPGLAISQAKAKPKSQGFYCTLLKAGDSK
jgi:hypothetical protein